MRFNELFAALGNSRFWLELLDEALTFLKSVLEGGEEASVELLDDLLVEEVSGSFAFSSGVDASGEGL